MPKLHTNRKRTAALVLCFVAVLSLLFVLLFSRSKPPRDRKLIENFYAHGATYERLRDMAQADKDMVRLASWGVETTQSPVARIPPDGEFPVSRYKEYLALLKEVGGTSVERGGGANPTIGIGVWIKGWAGDTRHVEICWVEQEPPNQVTNLDDFYQTPKPRSPVYRHIDANWYLWADW